MLYIILLIGIGFIFGFENMIAILTTLFFIYVFFTLFGVLFSLLPVLIVIGLIYYFLNKDKINYKYKSYKNFFEDGGNKNYYYKWDNTESNNYQNSSQSFYNNINNLDEYYSILGASKDLSDEDIKKKYKELAKKYHPDIHHNKPEEEKKIYEEKFKKIQEAYEKIREERKF
ncbi:DnaJ domain-containing protein [Haliovirga abyssi]|uniref:J domain-containing protein n=1 Tax=Haliovirga abyssi TaxID=2996794 RepID=A0AAU9DIS4_9FUSO|nr:DnaJ domain-containing protein [Haliovirga abyssi]BDU50669.1 hypothetical protein HLVA_12380 [Haliovirga abyssi]